MPKRSKGHSIGWHYRLGGKIPGYPAEMQIHHKPVMVNEVVEGLNIKPLGLYIDCTVGEGGHTEAILNASEPKPKVLGIDLDADALSMANKRFKSYKKNVTLVQGNFARLDEIAGTNGFSNADGILFDLGLSSLQLEEDYRGFSLLRTGKLDMRFDVGQELTAHELVNNESAEELGNIIFQFGEEPSARRIARAIVNNRPIHNTTDLAEVVARSIGRSRRRNIHPATRTFQALRIAVNGEIKNILSGLQGAIKTLGEGGRLVIISYHSLEDRGVKKTLRQESLEHSNNPISLEMILHQATIKVINRKVLKPSREEIMENPKSRSAKIRIAQRL